MSMRGLVPMRWAFLAVLAAGAALAQPVTIEISGANFRPMPIAVAAPVAQDDAAKAHLAELDEGLMFDFSSCGLFQVLDRKSFLADAKEGITASSINFTNWTNVGAETLVKTQVAMVGDEMRADLRLFTVAGGKEELK